MYSMGLERCTHDQPEMYTSRVIRSGMMLPTPVMVVPPRLAPTRTTGPCSATRRTTSTTVSMLSCRVTAASFDGWAAHASRSCGACLGGRVLRVEAVPREIDIDPAAFNGYEGFLWPAHLDRWLY